MSSSYRLACSHKVIEEFRALVALAEREGLRDELLAVAATLSARLEQEPASVGEPRFTYRNLNLQAYVVLSSPLGIDYSVDEERKIVYLQRFSFLPPPSSD